jgi:phenylalanyl-tRNA synthetase beta subunit
MAYALAYQADDRTLTDADVERQRNKIIRSLENQIGGVIRR